ncbi:MAG: hypothetical protein Q4A29_09745 [Eubacteriales bacterium]|nr:hypothetical protein [Eubacteriales bacterium]
MKKSKQVIQRICKTFCGRGEELVVTGMIYLSLKAIEEEQGYH